MKDTNQDNTKGVSWPRNREDYDLGEVIGIGSNAIVHEAFCKPRNEQCAIKRIRIENESKAICERKEIQTLTEYNHKNVIKYFTIFTVEEELWIVMSLVEKGSLLDLIKHKTSTESCTDVVFDETAMATVMRKVLKGLVYLHKKGQIHRDIKADNILLSEDGNVQLSGFGLGAWHETAQDDTKNYSTDSTIERKYWVAPEEIGKTNGYSFKTDIWSFGITTIEMATGTSPYETCSKIKDVLKMLADPVTIETVCDKSHCYKYGKEIKEMIAICLQKNPQTRPTAAELLKHPFFKKANKSKFLVQNVLRFGPSKELRSRIIKDGKKSTKSCGWLYQSETKEWIWSFGEPERLIDYLSSNADEEQVLAGVSTGNSSSNQEDKFHAHESSAIDDLIGLNDYFFHQTSFQLKSTSSGNQETSKTMNTSTGINDLFNIRENAAHKSQALIASKPVKELDTFQNNDILCSKGSGTNASRFHIENDLFFDTGFGFNDIRNPAFLNSAEEKDLFAVSSFANHDVTNMCLATSGRGMEPFITSAYTTDKTNVASASNIFGEIHPIDISGFRDYEGIDLLKETTYEKENHTYVFSAFPPEEQNAATVPNVNEEINLFAVSSFNNNHGIGMNNTQSLFGFDGTASYETNDASIFNNTEKMDPFGFDGANFSNEMSTMANTSEKKTFPFAAGASSSIKTNVSSIPNITEENVLFGISAFSKNEGIIDTNTFDLKKSNKSFAFSAFPSEEQNASNVSNTNEELNVFGISAFANNDGIDMNSFSCDKKQNMFGVGVTASYETNDAKRFNIAKEKDPFGFNSVNFSDEMPTVANTCERKTFPFAIGASTSIKTNVSSIPNIIEEKDQFGISAFSKNEGVDTSTSYLEKENKSFVFSAFPSEEQNALHFTSINDEINLLGTNNFTHNDEINIKPFMSDKIEEVFAISTVPSCEIKDAKIPSINEEKDLFSSESFTCSKAADMNASISQKEMIPFDIRDSTTEKVSVPNVTNTTEKSDVFGVTTFSHSEATDVQTITSAKGKNPFLSTAFNSDEANTSYIPSTNNGQDLFTISNNCYQNEGEISDCSSDTRKNPFLFNDFASVRQEESSITEKDDLPETNPFTFNKEIDVHTTNSSLSKNPFLCDAFISKTSNISNIPDTTEERHLFGTYGITSTAGTDQISSFSKEGTNPFLFSAFNSN